MNASGRFPAAPRRWRRSRRCLPMRFETLWEVWNFLPVCSRMLLADQAELQPWINHVQAGLRSLAATVNNVLHFHSQPSAQLLPVDLLRLVSETVEFLRPLARQKEMQIEWQAPQRQSVHSCRSFATPAGIFQLGAQCFPGDATRRNVVHKRLSARWWTLSHHCRGLRRPGCGHSEGEFGEDI